MKTEVTTVNRLHLFFSFLSWRVWRIKSHPACECHDKWLSSGIAGPLHLTLVSRLPCPCLSHKYIYLFDLSSVWPRGFSISIEVKEHDTASQLPFFWLQSDGLFHIMFVSFHFCLPWFFFFFRPFSALMPPPPASLDPPSIVQLHLLNLPLIAQKLHLNSTRNTLCSRGTI